MNLDGRIFRVVATAAGGVVSADTRLQLMQRGARVLGRYQGGTIKRGCLVGETAGDQLTYRYVQRESDDRIQAGHSVCDLRTLRAGTLQLVEHFTWSTRVGSGTNIFEEIDP